MRRSMDWTLEDKLVDCSSALHLQAAEETIPHVYKQERIRPTPVRTRLSRTQAVLWRAIPGGGCRCRGSIFSAPSQLKRSSLMMTPTCLNNCGTIFYWLYLANVNKSTVSAHIKITGSSWAKTLPRKRPFSVVHLA